MAWRLFCDRGQQLWKYFHEETSFSSIDFDPEKNPNSSDGIFRRNTIENNSRSVVITADPAHLPEGLPRSALQGTLTALNYYLSLQADDGHWPGDYGGPMFLLPGAVITSFVTKFQFKDEEKEQMIRYLFHHQLPDGGWGTHIESTSTMFGTVLNYIALRFLGLPADHPRIEKARDFIQGQGGAMFAPSWAKFWLCVAGLMPWNGMNSILPELWLLPSWLPFHPSRYWCHCRMVYLSMSYVYAEKLVAAIDPLVLQLREELYRDDYDRIDFTRHRDSISSLDLYSPSTLLLKGLNHLTNLYEQVYSRRIRDKASEYLIDAIHAEDEHTKYINIGPVNKFINMISICHGKGRESEEFQHHLDRVNDYLWLSEDGMKLQGYNGSQLWDTVFSIQAILETGLDHLVVPSLRSAYHYLEISQVREDVRDYQKYFRHQSKGGWPFSTRDHGWPITDCTAEGIKSTLLLHEKQISSSHPIDDERLEDAIDLLLSLQNDDGGWASYELQRGPKWVEWLNPSEVFQGIMIDYSYVECTSASLQALAKFRSTSNYRRKELEVSISRAKTFLDDTQRDDGSWYGSWAVCFTYGTWFAVEGLIAAGESRRSPRVRKAVEFLLSKQNEDGGWGESYLSCVKKSYVPHRHSQVINTSWALLTLILAEATGEFVEKGIAFLLRSQSSTGDWPQQGISGVFNGNCMISYTNYRNLFPIWALGRYLKTVAQRDKEKRLLS